MSYRDYVIAAYAVFALMLVWDYLIPRLQIRSALRAAKLRLARTASTPPRDTELPLSRD
ncbi:MAG: heme exporter protein CcmD [Thermomonas sp.]|jgi:heme exporter protein D|uniref:heme exporter protein CcmD n=1 Tax=Thermomonas sp. TaxID=1971895 RepID=UPI001ED2E125|nr:heme exporter protein CcmD [Thermomonas sp.]MBV2209162.1 heme exporter protein CcmD [Thermomonas sp.]